MASPLYLIDSSIYIYQAWHTLPVNIMSRDKQSVNAAYGFGEFLMKLLDNENPRYLVCAFDKTRVLCARKKLYPSYKANRKTTPDRLMHQFKWCEEIAHALGIACFSSSVVEADDIIGTFSQQARKQGISSIILSSDKDLAQFINPGDILWDFNKKHRYTHKDIQKKYNLNPNQIPDMLALAGDKVDNIPGVPGIGMHIASRLLFKWGNLDNLYANLDRASQMKFRGAKHVVKLLADFKESVYLSRRLTGLITDSSLPTNIDALALQPIKLDLLGQLFEKLAFSKQRQHRWLQVLSKLSSTNRL